MSSSYFESLGRQESAPFSMDELNYAETEPDLVKVMNEQINENIKDMLGKMVRKCITSLYGFIKSLKNKRQT